MTKTAATIIFFYFFFLEIKLLIPKYLVLQGWFLFLCSFCGPPFIEMISNLVNYFTAWADRLVIRDLPGKGCEICSIMSPRRRISYNSCSPIPILSGILETLRLGDIIEQISHSLPGRSLVLHSLFSNPVRLRQHNVCLLLLDGVSNSCFFCR